jgi:hypothetical protein
MAMAVAVPAPTAGIDASAAVRNTHAVKILN